MPRQSKFTWRFENEEYVHQRVVDLTMRQLACIDEYLPVARSCLADAFHAAARFEDVETRLPARLAARTAEYLAQRKTPGRPKKEITPEEFDKLRDLVCEYERELAETAASPDRKSRRRGEKSASERARDRFAKALGVSPRKADDILARFPLRNISRGRRRRKGSKGVSLEPHKTT
jgi:hypothetical protein